MKDQPKLWANVSPPFEGESFDSWLWRLSIGNGLWITSLIQHLGAVAGYKQVTVVLPFETSFLWLKHTETLTRYLVERTHAEPNDIEALYSGFTYLSKFERRKWLIEPRSLVGTVGVKNLERRALTQFCPLCLQYKGTPYLKRNWQFSFIVMCHEHRCLLLDKCPNCLEVLQLEKVIYNYLDEDKKEYSYYSSDHICCSHCERDLQSVTPAYPNFDSAPIIQVQHELQQLLHSGNKRSHRFYPVLDRFNKLYNSPRLLKISRELATSSVDESFLDTVSIERLGAALNIAAHLGLRAT